MKLSKLKKIDLRTVWKNEPNDFSQWLSQEENLSLLGEEIGIDISFTKTEASVGRYNVDILAEEENTGRKMIIENQLEYTDHDHLGKLVTYASGYDAEIIIWIVKDIREEHEKAVDWLNEHTDDEVNFFIMKIELWQIGDSPVAPKFQVISRPNEWAKAIRGKGRTTFTDTQMMQLEFWNRFKEYAMENGTSLRLRKAHPQHWYDISFGFSKAHITLVVDTQKNAIRCEIYIPDSKETFHLFYAKKEEIESELKQKLEWREIPDKKASRIHISKDADVTKKDEWENCFNWLMEEAEKFQNVFSKNK